MPPMPSAGRDARCTSCLAQRAYHLGLKGLDLGVIGQKDLRKDDLKGSELGARVQVAQPRKLPATALPTLTTTITQTDL